MLLIPASMYVASLHSSGLSGSLGKILNPEAHPDQWRYGPLADATVVVVWIGDVLDNPIDGHLTCVRAAHVKTDTSGRFSVPGVWSSPSWPMVINVRPHAYAYEPGFATPHRAEMPTLPIPGNFTVITEARSEAIPGKYPYIDPSEAYRCAG